MRLGGILSAVMGVSIVVAVLVGGGLLFYVGTTKHLQMTDYIASGIGVVLLAQALVSLYMLTQSDAGV
ncbi:MAG: hypothetical protein ABEI96_06575 [Haloarculaceae archaeon]